MSKNTKKAAKAKAAAAKAESTKANANARIANAKAKDASDKAAASDKAKAPAKAKKVGVIATIIKIIGGGKPVSKKQILARLVKAFPDRGEQAMSRTINCQLPSRLRSEKGLKIEKSEKGYQLAV